MRKLPQEFAFPLGLGSKKVQGAASAPNANLKNGGLNNNNDSANNIKQSSLDDVSDVDSHNTANGGRYISHSAEDLSPRAPYQDLDTINL